MSYPTPMYFREYKRLTKMFVLFVIGTACTKITIIYLLEFEAEFKMALARESRVLGYCLVKNLKGETFFGHCQHNGRKGVLLGTFSIACAVKFQKEF
jgi:hypothetical protein